MEMVFFFRGAMNGIFSRKDFPAIAISYTKFVSDILIMDLVRLFLPLQCSYALSIWTGILVLCKFSLISKKLFNGYAMNSDQKLIWPLILSPSFSQY